MFTPCTLVMNGYISYRDPIHYLFQAVNICLFLLNGWTFHMGVCGNGPAFGVSLEWPFKELCFFGISIVALFFKHGGCRLGCT